VPRWFAAQVLECATACRDSLSLTTDVWDQVLRPSKSNVEDILLFNHTWALCPNIPSNETVRSGGRSCLPLVTKYVAHKLHPKDKDMLAMQLKDDRCVYGYMVHILGQCSASGEPIWCFYNRYCVTIPLAVLPCGLDRSCQMPSCSDPLWFWCCPNGVLTTKARNVESPSRKQAESCFTKGGKSGRGQGNLFTKGTVVRGTGTAVRGHPCHPCQPCQWPLTYSQHAW
jgi:hypothetical protein